MKFFLLIFGSLAFFNVALDCKPGTKIKFHCSNKKIEEKATKELNDMMKNGSTCIKKASDEVLRNNISCTKTVIESK
jgi:preprotein translocase subunit SecF